MNYIYKRQGACYYQFSRNINVRYSLRCKKKKITSNFVKKTVLNYFNLKTFNINSRKRDYVYARQYVMFFLKRHTKLSLTKIGEPFKKDHATVLHAIRKIKAWIEFGDYKAIKIVDDIDRLLKE